MSRTTGLIRAVVLLAVAASAAGGAPAHASLAGGAPAAASPTVEHVVVVGVGGLLWSDVSARTPTLARLAGTGSVGALSVRAAPAPPRVTCPAEGWLTVGAGTYAAVLDPAGADTATGCAGRHPTPVLAGAVSGWDRIRRLNEGLRFGARPGLLGGSLPCAVAVGQGAALATADPTGHVDTYAERVPADPGPLLRRCPLTAVDLGSLPPGGPARAEALAAVDAQLSIVDAHRPARTVVAVLGLADSGEDGPHLHVAALDGPGFQGGWLRSASTRRTPYVQLSDVAPTVLRVLDVRIPGGLAGAPLSGGADGRPSTMDDTVAALTDADRAATSQRNSIPTFTIALALLWALVVVAAGVRRSGIRRKRPLISRIPDRRTPALLASAAIPGCTFLANLVPWWRSPWPAVTVTALVLGLAAAVAALACAGPWRRHGVLVVAGFTAAVLTVDGLTGTALQINSMLGYNPLVAGRFTGFGNLAFAVYGAAGLMFAALLAHRFRSPRAAVAVVLAVGAAMVVVDGLPAWGADVGGVLTLVPAFTVLALLVGRARVSAARLAAAGIGAAATAAAIGVADYLRAPDRRSHFGRFVAGVFDGTAGATLERKLAANLDLLVAGPHTWVALALVLVVTWFVVRPPAGLAQTFAAVPGLRPAVVAVAVLGWIGFATNDSGVAVPLLVALVAVPAVLAAQPAPTVGAERRRMVRPAPNGAPPRLGLHDR